MQCCKRGGGGCDGGGRLEITEIGGVSDVSTMLSFAVLLPFFLHGIEYVRLITIMLYDVKLLMTTYNNMSWRVIFSLVP